MIKGAEKDTTLITIVGLERMDITYYVARMLEQAGKKILIADNTRQHELFYSIRKAEEDERLSQNGNIYTIKNCAFSEEFFNQFDYVFVAHGFELNRRLWNESDYFYFQTDLKACTSCGIRKQVPELDTPVNLIVFDICGKKVSADMLREEIGLKKNQVQETYELYYNETDYLHYMQLLRNGAQSMQKVTSDTKNAVISIFKNLLPEVTKKDLKKILKRV